MDVRTDGWMDDHFGLWAWALSQDCSHMYIYLQRASAYRYTCRIFFGNLNGIVCMFDYCLYKHHMNGRGMMVSSAGTIQCWVNASVICSAKTVSQGSMFCKGLFHVSVFGIICRGGKTNTVVDQETATHWAVLRAMIIWSRARISVVH